MHNWMQCHLLHTNGLVDLSLVLNHHIYKTMSLASGDSHGAPRQMFQEMPYGLFLRIREYNT